MKYFNKVCVHDKVKLPYYAENGKYLNYETSVTRDLIGNVCLRFDDSEVLSSFGMSKNFHYQDMPE